MKWWTVKKCVYTIVKQLYSNKDVKKNVSTFMELAFYLEEVDNQQANQWMKKMMVLRRKRTVQWARKGPGRWQGGFYGEGNIWAETSRMGRNHLCKDLVWREPFKQGNLNVQRPWGRREFWCAWGRNMWLEYSKTGKLTWGELDMDRSQIGRTL